MNRIEKLAQRRAMLVAECGLQRNTLKAQLEQFELGGGWLQIGAKLFDSFKRYPNWSAAAIALLVSVLPGKLGTAARSALTVIQILRRVLKTGKTTPEQGASEK